MEASEQFKKIQSIATSKIPVSEESPIYSYFISRRALAKKMVEGAYSEDIKEYSFEVLNTIEDRIREYLYL